MRTPVVAAAVALALSLAPSVSRAQSANPYLSAALKLYGDMEYESTLDVLKKAQAAPGNTLDDDVKIRIYLGLVHRELGHDDEAESAFKAALALDPSVALPKQVAPKAEQLFGKAKKDIAKRRPPTTTTPDKPPDPTVAKPPPTTTIVVPPQPPPTDPGRTTTAKLVPLDNPTPLPSVSHGTSTRTVALAIGVPVLVIGAGLLGGGVYFGAQASGARSDADLPSVSQVEAKAKFESAQSSATNANLLYGIGAAVAVAGVVTVIVALASSSSDYTMSATPAEMPGTR